MMGYVKVARGKWTSICIYICVECIGEVNELLLNGAMY